jgi:hypothetical protein
MELWELAAREACRDTVAQYSHCGDRFLLEQLADAFCEDGILEVRGSVPLTGRRAIIDGLGGGRGTTDEEIRSAAKAEQSTGPRRLVRHNVTNIRFESISPTEANVASYFTVLTEIGPDHAGRYRDRLVPVGDRWLFAHRFVSTDWFAPNSLFHPARP